MNTPYFSFFKGCNYRVYMYIDVKMGLCVPIEIEVKMLTCLLEHLA